MRVRTNCFNFLFLLGLSGSAFADRLISVDELRKHKTEADCWMAVDGSVYDMSKLMKLHNDECKKMKLADYCGADGSEVWRKKESSESPHKRKARRALEKIKIGTLSPQ